MYPKPHAAYPWQRLLEALDKMGTVSREARHIVATVNTSLEHEAFGRHHDEKVLRVKARACLTMISKLLAAADELSMYSTTANAMHAGEVEACRVAAADRVEDSTVSGHAMRRALQREVRNLELECAEALKQQRIEFEHERAELHGQMMQMGEHIEAQVRAQDELREQLETLRVENVRLRQTALHLRGVARGAQESLAQEKESGIASQRGLKQVNDELQGMVHNLSGQLERAHAFIDTIRKRNVTKGVNEP